MPISKVVYAGDTLIDLTADTVTADNLAKGVTAHAADGTAITGTLIVDKVPGYVITEAESVIDRILAAQGTRTVVIAALADLHYGNSNYTDGIKHACQALKYIDSRVKLDIVTTLGDYTDGYPALSVDNALGDAKAINALMDGLRFAPNLRQQGNHDYYVDNNPITHRLIQAYSEDVEWGDKAGGYYLRDFEAFKLRVISINTVEEGYENINCSQAQYEWFAQSLDMSGKPDAEAWQILILSHHPLDWWTVEKVYVFPKIIKGYNDGLNSATASGYSGFPVPFDFSKGNNKAKIIANIHGHIHNFIAHEMYLNLGNTGAGTCGTYRIATPNACFGRENEYDGVFADTATYTKTADSADDTAFIIYCIDLDTYTINAICYGAGIDRTIEYFDVVETYTVTNTLTNATTSNSVSTVTEGEAYSATLSAAEGYELSSVVVSMGGVDITSTAYSNGVISISNVTGNIVIVAIAQEPEVTITNVLPLAVTNTGAPYNGGQGWKTNTRLGSAGTESTANGMEVTGFIPFKVGDTLYFKDITMPIADTVNTRKDWRYLALYRPDFTTITSAKGINYVGMSYADYTVDSSGNLASLHIKKEWPNYTGNTYPDGTQLYFRMSADEISSASVITINQPIE